MHAGRGLHCCRLSPEWARRAVGSGAARLRIPAQDQAVCFASLTPCVLAARALHMQAYNRCTTQLSQSRSVASQARPACMPLEAITLSTTAACGVPLHHNLGSHLRQHCVDVSLQLPRVCCMLPQRHLQLLPRDEAAVISVKVLRPQPAKQRQTWQSSSTVCSVQRVMCGSHNHSCSCCCQCQNAARTATQQA